MKTRIYLTAIAVITVFFTFSCSSDISLTERNLNEWKEQYKGEYTSTTPVSFTVDVRAANLTYSATPIGEQYKEITIAFPSNADILKETNANMTAKLQEFFTVFKYSNPAVIPEPYVHTPSTIGDLLSYTFVRRNENIINIKLDSVPNANKIEWRIDASKYKVYGQLTDINGDYIAGESYDDQYGTLDITDGTPIAGWSDEFFKPEYDSTISFTITPPAGGTFTTSNPSSYISLIASAGAGSDPLYAIQRKLLSDLLPNIELQKYNQSTNSWAKEGTVTFYEYTAPTPADFPATWTQDRLYVKLDTLDDLGIYRVKATGLKNISTTNTAGAVSKVRIYASNPTFRSILNNTYISDPVVYYNSSARLLELTSPIDEVTIKTDSNKRNVVLEVYFNSITDTINSGDAVYPEVMNTGDFIKTFKLVYNGTTPTTAIANGASLTTLSNIVEIKITDVKYTSDKRTNAENDKNDCAIITLDPAYQINGRSIYLLLSPDFKYGGGHITFGNLSTTGSFYNGSYFWRSYGFITNL